MFELLLLAGLQTFTAQTHPNLIVNGDFSLGNKGFTSEYIYDKDLGPVGNYYVGANPHTYDPGGASFGAHSVPSGNMLIANGSDKPGTVLWQQTVKVAPNHRYYFVVWAASWGQWGADGDSNPAKISLSVNGKEIASPFTLKVQDGVWTKIVGSWDSGSGKAATLRIVDSNTEQLGNDFAIDDLSFHA
jgi:hypothetical protein